jgi:hypothetical protein
MIDIMADAEEEEGSNEMSGTNLGKRKRKQRQPKYDIEELKKN